MTIENKDGIFLQIDEHINENMSNLALNILSRLRNSQDEIPVDTGWYANNWQISIGRPKTGKVGKQPKKGEKLNVEPLPFSDIAAVSTYNAETMGPVWIVNNVPYALRLNAKHKQKAHHVQKIVQSETDKLA